jgi:hypothetical protein
MLLETDTKIIFTAAGNILFNLILGFNFGELAKMPMNFRELLSKTDSLYVLKLEARHNLKRFLCEDPPVRVAITYKVLSS